MRSMSRFSSTLPFLKGVMSATSEPENIGASSRFSSERASILRLNSGLSTNGFFLHCAPDPVTLSLSKGDRDVGQPLNFDSSLKYLCRRAGHVDVIILRPPFNL